jgi:hypothetical protein
MGDNPQLTRRMDSSQVTDRLIPSIQAPGPRGARRAMDKQHATGGSFCLLMRPSRRREPDENSEAC